MSKLYRGKSPAEYGLWRHTDYGYWVFSVPVHGEIWRMVETPDVSKLVALEDSPASSVTRRNS